VEREDLLDCEAPLRMPAACAHLPERRVAPGSSDDVPLALALGATRRQTYARA
jgi:hypothetical protein